MIKVDLHVHTSLSDGDDIERVTHYAKIKNLKAIAITDHDTLMSIKIAKRIKDILVIPGIELGYDFGHILIIGINEDFKIKLNFYEMIDLCKDNGYVTILAHPAIFLLLMKNYIKRNYNKIKLLNAIEVYNSMYISFNLMKFLSEKVANVFGLTKVGGSDAHKAEYVGNCYTLLDSETSIDEILQAVIKGKAHPYGFPSPLIGRLELSIKTVRHFLSTPRARSLSMNVD